MKAKAPTKAPTKVDPAPVRAKRGAMVRCRLASCRKPFSPSKSHYWYCSYDHAREGLLSTKREWIREARAEGRVD